MKLKELFEAPQSPSFLSKIKRAINPTGEGEKRLAARTHALVQRWADYRGETNAIPNAANIEHWVKDTMGLDSPEIWNQAVDEFSEENPKAGQKYKTEENLDPGEVSKFLSKLVQIRVMNPTIPLWTQRSAQRAAQQAQMPGHPVRDTTAPGNKKEKEQSMWDPNKGNAASANPNWTGGRYTGKVNPDGMPAHPVTAAPTQTAQQSEPAQANPKYDYADSLRKKHAAPFNPAATNNPGINPEPVDMNKPAMLKPDDKNAVDWEKVRSRFPEKPRVKVKMDSRPGE